ncbi:MAG TPA: PAS domain S-box protein, partial [Geothrix sp.]|nr:PAS domain S-box protein [Geothrix sp.]
MTMGGGEEEGLVPSSSRSLDRQKVVLVLSLLMAAGAFLLGALAYPGEYHEGDALPGSQSWLPVLASGVLAALAFVTAGFILGVLRRASAAVPAPEPKFREIFASAPDGMVLLDGERIVAANPSLEALSGAQAQSLDGQDVALLFAEPAEGEDTLERLFSRPVAASVPIHEVSLRKRDGASPRVEVSGFPFPWRGRALRVLQIRDITERKSREEARLRAEVALRKSESGLRAVVTHSPVAFFAFDKDGNFTLAEGKALEPMGLRKSDLEGQSAFAKAGRLRPM